VEILTSLDNTEYDLLLCNSILLVEYFDVSASNTVIEAIARNTPIVVNRHAALEEYLGIGYPLFYDDIEEVHGLLSDHERVHAAHLMLSTSDKSWIPVETFVSDLLGFVASLRE
jgi:hypothetical protein